MYFCIHSFARQVFVHPRRPRGSQSGRKKRRDESFHVLETFAFSPDPTDCPWVSEDGVCLVLWLMIQKWGTRRGKLARLGFFPIFSFSCSIPLHARCPLLLFWATLRYQGEMTSRMIKGAARNTIFL